jgi:alkanesulfonate monooxygenase SsuD/methylene tetrahydromethanopterin reductase-like flavin-dependent oxidoreductase (luciferase family)
MVREMHVARDSRRAEEEMREPFQAMYASYARWGQPGERYDLDFDELKNERVLVGSPQEVAERIVEYGDEFDVPFMLFRLYYPGMDPELALETIRMFGEEVIPVCRAAGDRPEPAVA